MRLAVFDLDGTLIRGQSQQIALKHLLRMHRISPLRLLGFGCWFFLYRAGVLRDPDRIRCSGYQLLAGLSKDEMDKLSAAVCESLRANLRPEIVAALQAHQDAGDDVLIISASADPIVHDLAASLGVKASLGTRLEIRDAAYTGAITNKPLYGQAKADALAKYLERHGALYTEVTAYGDHHSDIPLLAMANRAVCVCPDRGLHARARQLSWSVMICR